MLDKLISLLAPHPCFSCGALGSNLCDYCKYNIESEYFDSCVLCARVTLRSTGVCSDCLPPYSRVWCIGERHGTLSAMINALKFENNYEVHKNLASLLSNRIGQLPSDVVIVPVPTIAAHIRQRGYDHARLLARAVARQQNVRMTPLLARASTAVQLGANKKLRQQQASQAFKVRKQPMASVTYLLVDDVMTTGATLHYAAKALKDAGAHEVWAAVVARQPLD